MEFCGTPAGEERLPVVVRTRLARVRGRGQHSTAQAVSSHSAVTHQETPSLPQPRDCHVLLRNTQASAGTTTRRHRRRQRIHRRTIVDVHSDDSPHPELSSKYPHTDADSRRFSPTLTLVVPQPTLVPATVTLTASAQTSTHPKISPPDIDLVISYLIGPRVC